MSRYELIVTLSMIFEKNFSIVLNNSKFTKNELYFYCGINQDYIKLIVCGSFLLDTITYDSTSFSVKYAKTPTIDLYYTIRSDTYVSVSNYAIRKTSLFLNSCWLDRECLEFFGNYSSGMRDSRNLLVDYSIKHNFLLKKVTLSSFSEFRYTLNNCSLVKKTQIVL